MRRPLHVPPDQRLTPDQAQLADWLGEQMALAFARGRGLLSPEDHLPTRETDRAEVDS